MSLTRKARSASWCGRALLVVVRRGSVEPKNPGRFNLLGATRPRSAIDRSGGLFVSVCPAISSNAAKAIRQAIRRWRLHLQGSLSLADLARQVEPDRARLDQLLRSLLPDRVAPFPRSHQPVSDAMGHAEVQAVASSPQGAAEARGISAQARAPTLRSLASRRNPRWMMGAG